jgi:hypothetical protein
MKRALAATGLTLLAVICPLNAQKRESDIIDWNKRPEWKEKSLKNESDTTRVYRELLQTPFWGQALARLTIEPDRSGELITKVRDYHEPHSITTTSRKLDSAEVDNFLSGLDEAEFWFSDSTEEPSPGLKDADVCTLEGASRGTYQAVQRAIPPRTQFTRVCEYFVRPALVKAANSGRKR